MPITGALLAALTLAACHKREAPLPANLATEPSVLERVKVLNADVLIVDGKDIRVAGAYAPQPIPQARCWAEALAANQSAQVVRMLMRDAQSLTVEPTGERDEYNREITRVFVDRQDLSITLHQAGLTAAIEKGHFPWCEPMSLKAAGAPELRALMDLGGG